MSENTPDSGRDDLVLVVTPWYPTPDNPMWGTFVRDAVQAMSMHYRERIIVVHVDGDPLRPGETAQGSHWSWWETRDEADVLIIRAPHPANCPRSESIVIHREALAAHACDLLARARVVSAHVGGPTGAAVAPLLARHTRFTITEHATYVRGLFQDTMAAVPYRAAVARAARVLAVSDVAAATLRRLCPQQADDISSVPNPVRFDILPLRAEPVRRHDRWLYVGNLVERKGVRRLLEAFIEEAAERAATGGVGDLRLTIVGDGPLREELTEQAVAGGVADRVDFVGAVAPDEVPIHFADQDVLVHLSDYETFGLTVVEAAATGLPVVVTRCGGPEETMVVPAGFGLCAFVDVGPTTGQVRSAIRSLRTDQSVAQLRRVREMLRTLYGFERSADLLATYVLGDPPAKPLAPPVDLSIVIAFQGPRQWQRVRHGADRAADLGVNVTAVDLVDEVSAMPHGIALVTPGNADRYNALRSVERAVVHRMPRAALRGAEKIVPRLPAKAAKPALRGITVAERAHRKVSSMSEQRVYLLVWKVIRGRTMARRVEVQPELAEMERLDALVHVGGRMTQLAYRLAMRHPEAIVHHGAFSGTHLARWWLAAHAAEAAAGVRAQGAS